jgi:membrane protease YdiL (CAAX protease family)
MRVIIFFIIVLSLSAALSPLLYNLIALILPTADWPFSRIFDRVLLALLLGGIFVVRARLFYRHEIKFWPEGSDRAKRLSSYCLYFAVTLSLALLVLPLLVYNGKFIWSELEISYLLSKLPSILLAALVISLLEEFLFRGLLLGLLMRRMSFAWSAVISSAIFAVLHCFKPDKAYQYNAENYWAGFEYLFRISAAPFSLDYLPAMFGLFIVGVLLCCVARLQGALLGVLAIHSALIIASKLTIILTDRATAFLPPQGFPQHLVLVSQPEVWVGLLLVLIAFLSSLNSLARESSR